MAGRHRQTRGRSRGRHRKPSRRADLVLPVLTAAAVLSLVGVGVGTAAAIGSGHEVHDLAKPHTVQTVPLPASAPSPTSTAITTGVPAPAQLPWFSVTAIGRISWVQILDGHRRVLYSGMLRHGRTVSFDRRPLQVTIGDAGAVQLVVRHRARTPAGKSGAVLSFSVR